MDKTKAKIQSLCPDLPLYTDCGCMHHMQVFTPLTLAVVLRAIAKSGGFKTIDDQDWLLRIYDLEHDTYDQQSEECKWFIGSLLGL